MTIMLTLDLMKKIYPNGYKAVMTAFVNKQALMSEILATPERAALCFANMFAETSGFALRGLTENIYYSAERMAEVWKKRFPGGAATVQQRYGTGPDWQLKAFDEIYGGRMGNRLGTSDGSTYIGRGGPQLTGRDEYQQITDVIGVDLIGHPELATTADLQPDIIAAYWKQKRFNQFCDSGNVDIVGARKRWNGGTNGLTVVQKQYPRIFAILNAHVPVTAAENVQVPTADIDPSLKEIQQELINAGYHEVGEADGMIGGKTLGAIKAFFTDRGIDARAEYPSQILFNELNKVIQEGWKRPIAPGRAFATEEQLTPKITSIAPTRSASFFAKIAAWFSGAGTVIPAALQMMPTAREQATPYISMVQEWFHDIPGYVPMGIVLIIAIVIVVQANKANKATTEDYQKGKIN